MARIIQSPGVQITETDLSLSPASLNGTNIFATGFAASGPTDQLIQVTSVTDFEQVYGAPTNPAERYLFYTAKQILDSGTGNLFINRLPYGPVAGDGFGSKYSALVYPVTSFVGYSTNLDATAALGLSAVLSDSLTSSTSATYLFGTPKFFELTEQQYLSCVDGSGFNWSSTSLPKTSITSVSAFGNAGLVILNKAQVVTNNAFEGYYVGVVDNSNLLPTTDYDSINTVYSVASSAAIPSFVTIPTTKLDFTLSSTNINANGSLSEVIENLNTFDTSRSNGQSIFDDTVNIGVFKLFKSPFAYNASVLTVSLAESFNGSFDANRQINNVNGGLPISYFIGTQSIPSNNITVLVNDNISNRTGNTWLDTNGVPSKKVRFLTAANQARLIANNTGLSAAFGVNASVYKSASTSLGTVDALYPLGAYADQAITTKDLGNIPLKLDRALTKIDNDEIVNIDLIVEAGLGTIYAVASANATNYYDDSAPTSTGLQAGLNALANTNDYTGPTNTNEDLRTNYNTIINKFINTAQFVRKDCLFISDPIRHIFIKKDNVKTLSDKTKSFSQYIYSALRHLYEGVNSSFITTYANWVLVNDGYTGLNVWVPFSGYAANLMAVTDRNAQPWIAAAGFNRGVVTGASDLAIYPKQKERDQLYKLGQNPVTLFPSDGFVVFGQKTLLKQPSSFDRINVRRLFLYLEKATKSTAKFFVFEPNTLFTRTRIINTLSPIFENAKNTQGIYDYLIVCDERNNPASVIDANELVIDIYIKPVRTSEFILINFYATRTSTNFNEII